VAYGTGIVPLEETLDVLRQAGFDGPLCVELGQIAPGDDERVLVERCLSWLGERGISITPAATRTDVFRPLPRRR
jgi:hypothetical protein